MSTTNHHNRPGFTVRLAVLLTGLALIVAACAAGGGPSLGGQTAVANGESAAAPAVANGESVAAPTASAADAAVESERHDHWVCQGYAFACGNDHDHPACDVVAAIDRGEWDGMDPATEAGYRAACDSTNPNDGHHPEAEQSDPPAPELATPSTIDPALVV